MRFPVLSTCLRNYAIVACVLCVCICFVPAIQAEDEKEMLPKPQKFQVETVDGVLIKGEFYPPKLKNGGNAANSPVVILMHPVGLSGMVGIKYNREDWGDFPKTLQKAGYCAVTFDFRVYGESTKIKNPLRFWQVRQNQLTYFNGIVPLNPPDKISARSFRFPNDYAMLANDLVAVKVWLNSKNNNNECNANEIALVGAEQSCLVGLFFAVGEYTNRDRINLKDGNPQGEHIKCFIWLTMTHMTGKYNINKAQRTLLGSMAAKIPTLLIYGAKDNYSNNYWKNNYIYIKPNVNPQLYKNTKRKVLDTNLAGVKLLGKGLGADKAITAYLQLDDIMPANGSNGGEVDNRRTPTSLFNLKSLGLPGRR